MSLRNIDRYVRSMREELDTLEIPRSVEDKFGRYRNDPVGFVKKVLGAKSAKRLSDGSPYQFEVLSDLASYPKVCVRSGHGVGKSTVDAWATLWWLLTRPMSRVIIVAPEFSRQVRAVLFSEIRKWARGAKVKLPVSVLASRVIVEGYGEEWSATGMPATEPDRIEGFHSDAGVLLILDETKGIPQETYDALQGALTGLEENRLLVTSTPGGPSGPFYRIWAKGGDSWRQHHIPSTDSSLVSPEWIEDRKRDWGVGSPLYEARVLGNFPDSGEGILFPLSLLEPNIDREIDGADSGETVLGVDVARSIAGDQNCIAASRGGKIVDLIVWRTTDTMETVEKVAHEVVARGASRICVDVGGVGAGVHDRLEQLGYTVEGVHFGGSATDTQRFRNRRAEMHWTLRESLERGEVSLPDDDDLIADLASIRYLFTQDGRIQIESKDECRKRLGRSPDRADALALAVAACADPEPPFIFIAAGDPWPDEEIEAKGIAFDEEELRRMGGVWMPDDPLPI